MKQLSLFLEGSLNNGNGDKIQYNKIHRNLSTFKSGLTKSVHSWFRLTPSFGPDLVQIVFKELECNQESIVLDPFAGAGTTLIESQMSDIRSYGFEINPFLYFIGKTSLNWNLSFDTLVGLMEKIRATFKNFHSKYESKSCEHLPISMPGIHNVYRWWRADVLKDMLLLKLAIIECTKDSTEYRDFFYLCFAGVIIPDLTNITLGRLQLHFKDKSDDEINVFKIFWSHLELMLNDYQKLAEQKDIKPSTIFHTDSTELGGVVINDKIDIVMTSPPYPNRYSYIWNTRPLLYFFDFIVKAKEAADIDKKTIGGTWGTATSILSKGIIDPINQVVEKHVKPVTDEIRKIDNLMANYVMKYFNLLTTQIIKMDSLLSKKAKLAYIVGNTEIKGTYVSTDEILCEIFRDLGLGYSESWVNRFRRRHSGKDLFESIVFGIK